MDATRNRLEPVYDMVLIDEAQDFGSPVFELIYALTKPPKRIIWAYDEFQSLTDIRMKEPEDLFGRDEEGRPHIPNSALSGTYPGDVPKDFALKNSYRNPRFNLMVAHGAALGLHRPAGVIDIIEDRASWEAIGYRFVRPETGPLGPGQETVVQRPDEYSKNNLELFLRDAGRDEQGLVTSYTFDHDEAETAFVVEHVHELISKEGVHPEDIFVITLDTQHSRTQLTQIRQALDERGVKAVMPGFLEPAWDFKREGFVTLTTPHRAKGNEVNIVFVMTSQRAVSDPTFRARNALFVAITRSRGWTYVTGVGRDMAALVEELDAIRREYPTFVFQYPTDDAIARNRWILTIPDERVEQKQEQVRRVLEDEETRMLLYEWVRNHPEDLRNFAKEAGPDDLESEP